MKIPEKYKSPEDRNRSDGLSAPEIQMERWIEDMLDHIRMLQSKLDQIHHISNY